jgi:23S rRNA (uracil1939-C5)-methyltransferase
VPPKRHRHLRQNVKVKRPSFPKELFEVTVHKVGAKGDGLAKDAAGQDFFVPYSAEGDVAEVRISAKRADGFVADIVNLITPGAHRIAAPCPHFAKCGGCSLQHLDETAYKNWKLERISESLARHQVNAELLEPVLVPAGHRRRASFAVMKKAKMVLFGFNARASHRIEQIEGCLVLNEKINALIKPLRDLLPLIMKREGEGDVIVNYAGQVCDIVFSLPGEMNLNAHHHLMEFAEKYNIGRMSWLEDGKGEMTLIAKRSSVTTQFGKTMVELPAAPFLQPSKMGEDALVEFAMSAFKDEKKILDLYSGCGSFTFALAEQGIVHAIETNVVGLKALEISAGRAGLGGRITTEERDLDRQPVMGKELDKFDAVLLDPPRAGASEQVKHLAISKVPLVISISCNPATFARDTATLVEGGYVLERLLPVDQFTWSAHVEVAGIFRK